MRCNVRALKRRLLRYSIPVSELTRINGTLSYGCLEAGSSDRMFATRAVVLSSCWRNLLICRYLILISLYHFVYSFVASRLTLYDAAMLSRLQRNAFHTSSIHLRMLT